MDLHLRWHFGARAALFIVPGVDTDAEAISRLTCVVHKNSDERNLRGDESFTALQLYFVRVWPSA